MARQIKLRELVPATEPDTLELPDGQVFVLPQLGIDAMANLLIAEEDTADEDAFTQLREQKTKLLGLIADANPDKTMPDIDLTVDELMELIAVVVGTGGAIQAVRDALARDEDDDEPASDEDAKAEAAELGEAAGLRNGDDDAPLASAKPSPKRSSRSGRSGSGGRSGGKESAGRSSSRSSSKSSARTGG